MNISNVGVEEDSRGGQAVAERNGAGGGGQKAEGHSESGWPCWAEAQDAGVVARGESL